MVFTWHFFVCLFFHLWTVLTFTICTLHLPINWPSCGWVELWEKGVVADENCRPFTDDRKRINWYYSLELKNSQFLDLYASAGRCFSRISEPFLSWVEKNQYPNEKNWGKWIQSVCFCLISLYQLWIVTISLWISFRSGVGIRGNCVMPWNPNIRHGVSIVLKMYIPGLKILYRTTTLWAENASRNLNTYTLSGWDCPTAKQNVPH